MNKSESIAKLADALSKFQGEIGAVEFNAVNPFLKNKYADLGAIIKTAKPIMAKHGLSVSQMTSGENGEIGVETVLMHASGEYISNQMSLPLGEERGKSTAQVAGSIVTYLRRYSLASILGIYSDEDGDGNEPPAGKTENKSQKAPSNGTSVHSDSHDNGNGNGNKPAKIGRFDSVDDVKAAIFKKMEKYEAEGVPVSSGLIGLMVGTLDSICGGDNQRHRFLKFITGEGSSKKMNEFFAPAIMDWAKDSENATKEARAIVKEMDAQAELFSN